MGGHSKANLHAHLEATIGCEEDNVGRSHGVVMRKKDALDNVLALDKKQVRGKDNTPW